MRFTLPLSSADALANMRQWASEIRGEDVLTSDDFSFVDLPITNINITTYGTAGGTEPALSESRVVFARFKKIGELVKYRIGLAVKVTFADNKKDVAAIRFDMPFLSRISNVAFSTPSPTGLDVATAYRFSTGNAHIVVRKLVGLGTYDDLTYQGFISEQVGVDYQPRQSFSVRKYDALTTPSAPTVFGALPYAYPNASLIHTILQGEFETFAE